MSEAHEPNRALPPLRELGLDLLRVPSWRRNLSLAMPFVWCGAYFVFAAFAWWPAAVFALMALSFVTYGSISHDLVHRSLGLPSSVNDVLLCVIELLALRSGHAYQAAHLHHHARFPHSDDVEAAVASRSLLGALTEGVLGQFRIGCWTLKNANRSPRWITGQDLACMVLTS